MKFVIIICLAFTGAAYADTDKIDFSPKKQVKFESGIQEYNLQKNDSLLLNYQFRLDLLEYKYEISESKYNDLKSKYNALKSSEHEIASASQGTSLIVKGSAKQLTGLSNKYIELKSDFDQLTNNINNEGTKFEVWSGLLLACVAVLVTVLGVGIALLAFWGYKNIRELSIAASLDKSEIMINEAIQNGEFNDVIYAAVERAVYRGVLSDEDFPEEIEESNNEVL